MLSCFHLFLKLHFPAADAHPSHLNMKVSSTICVKRMKVMHKILGCFEA